MSRPKKKPSFTKEQLGENPFYILIEVVKVPMKGQFKLVNREKEPVVIELEKSKYTKVYKSTNNRLKIAALSARAKSLFMWIIFTVKNGEDYVWINRDRYVHENETSIDTYIRGSKELILNNIINSTEFKDVFWINPNFIFDGNRVAKYPDYLVYPYEDL